MVQLDDRILCDYLFDLLDENEKQMVEHHLQNSDENRRRLALLERKFSGLELVKEEFENPVSGLKRFVLKAAVAALLLIGTGSLLNLPGNHNRPLQNSMAFGASSGSGYSVSTGVDYQAAVRCHCGGQQDPTPLAGVNWQKKTSSQPVSVSAISVDLRPVASRFFNK